ICMQGAGSQSSSAKSKKKLWKEIEPYFEPAPDFKNEFGDYRSPLKFYNGSTVASPQDWKKRREEITTQWHKMMGEWPKIITDQEFEYIESTERENIVQQKIRFKWLPNHYTEVYLLVPEGKGKIPAVITVFYEPHTAIGLGKPNRDFAFQLA